MLKPTAMAKLRSGLPDNIDSETVVHFIEEARKITLKSKQHLISAGDIADKIYLVTEGSLKVTIIDEEGREMIVAQINAGEFIGELGVFDPEETRSVWITARENVEVVYMTYSHFREVSLKNTDLLFLIGSQIAKRLKRTTRKLGDLTFLEVAGRIAKCLNDLGLEPDAISHPDGLQIRITRQDLGLMVGCSREMAGKVLKQLEGQGLIAVEGKTITLLKQ